MAALLRQYVLIPDLHVPFHDKAFIRLLLKIVSLVRPDGIVQMGDHNDFYELSKFSKDPSRAFTFEDELDLYYEILNDFDAVMPKGCEWTQLVGNHEDRLARHVFEKSPQLNRAMKDYIPKRLDFDGRNQGDKVWTYISKPRKWDYFKIGDAVIHHGKFFNKHVEASNLERYRCKFVQVHTHRYGMKTNGQWWCYNIGHGADVDQIDYTLDAPLDWQQGFALLTEIGGRSEIEPVLVNNGQCHFRGRLVKA